ncbi:signal peptidase II [Candidatus Woesearchaeota archaeon]|nr:signal peptidase II [Candidatus Woesearchaeota archaeon]
MKSFARNTIILIALVIIDQLLKYFFEKTRFFADLGIFALHYATNTGASFGMLQGNNILFIWISIMVLGIIMLNADKIKKEHTIPLILIVSGIIGNLIDRIFRGYVVDFIDFKFWPVFNLADSLVVIGVIWLIIVILKEDLKINKKDNKKKATKKIKSHAGD